MTHMRGTKSDSNGAEVTPDPNTEDWAPKKARDVSDSRTGLAGGRSARPREVARLLDAAAAGQTDVVPQHLRHAGLRLGEELLEWVRRDELLLRPRSSTVRRDLRFHYLRWLLDRGTEPSRLRAEVVYLSFAEVVGDLRDEIARAARNEAEFLATLGLRQATELCQVVVVAEMRRVVRLFRNAQRSSETRIPPGHDRTATLAELAFEFGGIRALLGPMVSEVHAACVRMPRQRSSLPLMSFVRSAQRLLRTAEQWQTCAFMRQRVAFSLARIERVERGPRLFVAPSNLERSWRSAVANRRIALGGAIRQADEDVMGWFPCDVADLVRRAASMMPTNIHLPEGHQARAATAIHEVVTSGMRAVDVLLLRHADEETTSFIRALWCSHLLALATAQVASAHPALSRRGVPYVMTLDARDVASAIAGLAATSEATADRALRLTTSDPAKAAPIHLSTRPYLRLDPESVAVLRSPGVRHDPFMETRRTLAAEDATSRYVGAAYEAYIRDLYQTAGFLVAPSRVTLRSRGETVTDVEVLAYKDGITFATQTKCLPEPDSIYALWKTQQHVDTAIRQCLLARSFLRDHPDAIPSAFGNPGLDVGELCCVVVTPAVHFGSDSAWPVYVVDDQYFNHVLTIGEVRKLSVRGEVLERVRLYDGAHPTGTQFRDLLSMPAHVATLHAGGGASA
jgi:hypothetical protein